MPVDPKYGKACLGQGLYRTGIAEFVGKSRSSLDSGVLLVKAIADLSETDRAKLFEWARAQA